ncbi:hypothetical protein GCM10011518_33480 [Flavobacterium limi]|uniref:Uncharacterized protein n=2 Tax=Flavobacterium limi TaxID=2045105 RepID=A0ABQ1ULF5_9FLAO|nr:hypothetical protein [Flavobacterium limi]GGF21607.1 hypothetical protein GCM10011518_33480 [Flavobacterium limi]
MGWKIAGIENAEIKKCSEGMLHSSNRDFYLGIYKRYIRFRNELREERVI